MRRLRAWLLVPLLMTSAFVATGTAGPRSAEPQAQATSRRVIWYVWYGHPFEGIKTHYRPSWRLEEGWAVGAVNGTKIEPYNTVLIFQKDGNWVIYRNSPIDGVRRALWASGTARKQPAPLHLRFQIDGGIVIYNDDGKPVYGAGTKRGALDNIYKIVLFNDGCMAVYHSAARFRGNFERIWTNGHC